jgi:hypothetical protein
MLTYQDKTLQCYVVGLRVYKSTYCQLILGRETSKQSHKITIVSLQHAELVQSCFEYIVWYSLP